MNKWFKQIKHFIIEDCDIEEDVETVNNFLAKIQKTENKRLVDVRMSASRYDSKYVVIYEVLK